jgi:hypothetical protein
MVRHFNAIHAKIFSQEHLVVLSRPVPSTSNVRCWPDGALVLPPRSRKLRRTPVPSACAPISATLLFHSPRMMCSKFTAPGVYLVNWDCRELQWLPDTVESIVFFNVANTATVEPRVRRDWCRLGLPLSLQNRRSRTLSGELKITESSHRILTRDRPIPIRLQLQLDWFARTDVEGGRWNRVR